MYRNAFIVGTVIFSLSSVILAEWEALPNKAPEPANNPTTLAKTELGRMLFMDPRFSSTGTVSCNSCHNVMLGGEDNRSVSMGVHGKTGGRSAPTVWNSAFSGSQFWDGRAKTLEEQAKGPVTNPIEMGMKDLDTAIKRLQSIPGYKPYFEKAFGKGAKINVNNAAKAVAAYERTLITPNSAYDKYVKGNKKSLNSQQLRGMKKFAETGCTSCHSGSAFNGANISANKSLFMKFPIFEGSKYISQLRLKTDKGRYEVSKNDVDKNVWKVPTLRNISMTAPYFHNGSVKTLDEAVEVMAKTQLNKTLSKKDVKDIVVFLDSLTGEFPKQTMPHLPKTKGWTLN